MRAFLVLLVVAAACGAGYVTVVDRASHAFGPQEFADGHIRITMPGEPSAGLTCGSDGPCVAQQAWASRLRGWSTLSARALGFRPLVFAVGMTELGKPPRVAEQAEMRARSAAAAVLGLETGHEFDVQRGSGSLGGSPANEFVVSTREGEVIWREMQVGARYYVAVVGHHGSVSVAADAQRFFESYSLPKGF